MRYPKVVNGRVAQVLLLRDMKTGELLKRTEFEDGTFATAVRVRRLT
jgi:hypothetical protein